MGGHLGTAVALLLDQLDDVEIFGIDLEPPRRHLENATFRLVAPEDDLRIRSFIAEANPTHLIHLGIYEPHARSSPAASELRSATITHSVFNAALACDSVANVVVRSGLEVYGRRRGAPLRPDEDCALDPTSRFGRTLQEVELSALAYEQESGVPVTRLRFAPIVGPHLPSPIGRYLRLPVVPVGTIPDHPFSLLHIDDMAAAVLRALARPYSGPLNIVGAGAVTGSQAARLGGRLPLPVAGPLWALARTITGLMGSPLPEHGLELLTRGRTADGSRASEALGYAPRYSTLAVVKELYEWASVSYMPADRIVA